MIDETGLLGFAREFRDVRQLEKDYLLILLLHEIFSVFTNELVFKGGTALKYFYNLNRFSEDIDFSYVTGNGSADGPELLDRKMESSLDKLGSQYKIVGKERRTHKTMNIIDGVNYTIRVAGPLNERTEQLQNIKIDFSLRNDLILKPELKYLYPQYPDIATFSLRVMDIREILAEKIAAVTTREKMRDIYDIYYLLVLRKLKYDNKLVGEKMRKRGGTFNENVLAKKLDAARNKMEWKSELAYIVNTLPDNIEVVSKLDDALHLAKK